NELGVTKLQQIFEKALLLGLVFFDLVSDRAFEREVIRTGFLSRATQHRSSPTGMRRTRPCTRVRSWTMCSISPTPARRSGRTAPTARQVEARLKEKGL